MPTTTRRSSEKKKETKMKVGKIEKSVPKPIDTRPTRYYVINFSIGWFENKEYKRMDDSIHTSMQGYPSLREIREELPKAFGIIEDGKKITDVAVVNVGIQELPKADYDDYIS